MAPSGDAHDVTSFTSEQIDALTEHAKDKLDQLQSILEEISSRLQELTAPKVEGERERPEEPSA